MYKGDSEMGDKKIVIGFVSILVLACGLLPFSGLFASEHGSGETEEMCIPMGTFYIEPPESIEASRSKVSFPHSLHFSYNCNVCHHTWTGEGQIKNCMTSGCHDQTQSPKKAVREGSFSAEAIQYFKYAYHNQCIGCHREIRQANAKAEKRRRLGSVTIRKTGPTGCVQCHPREE